MTTLTCDACGNRGFLETTEDRIERCDACKRFTTDQDAFGHWVAQHFLPLIDRWKIAKRNTTKQATAFNKIDAQLIDRYRVYRNTNKYLNITERRAWWTKRREEFEEMERRTELDSEGRVPPGGAA